ncbi:mitochondrial antiviral-signaling protein [Echeneis naucrates]|uniref:Mitochondrial antiviral-signaling protein n=1 Tax=Echeneis naucrates TaxID=173247 RepID=A0A665WY87_ECHNA|nr:mitochondrial antiviral-signaling protein [Echeneis naucrates]
MSFVSDKLYNGYLRRRMPMIASKVKVREIIVHLPCLTAHDRENIEAKRETYGNHDSMVLLLECLRRRENWPEQFIEALEACEHPTIAAELRAEYNALRGANNSIPSSPSTTATRAHVHVPPPASHPENDGNAQAAIAPPAEDLAPPQPASQDSPPLDSPVQPQPQSSAAHVPEAVPPPVPEPPQTTETKVVHPPSTPPPSPVTSHGPASPPLPQREFIGHQEPEENSESDIQGIAVSLIPDQVSAGETEFSANSVVTSPLSCPDTVGTTATTEVRPPQRLSPTQANSEVTDSSSLFTLKPPVQDTTPNFCKIIANETSKPSAVQDTRSSPQGDTAASSFLRSGAVEVDTAVADDSVVCVSDPSQLISYDTHDNPTIPVCDPLEPYSGDSQRLEVSDDVTSAHVPAVSGQPCQENGIELNHNKPEENHYESPSQSFVVHVSEEPSLLNLDSQVSAPQAETLNGEAAREMAPPAPSSTVPRLNTPSEPRPADITPKLKTQLESEDKAVCHTRPTSTKYIMTAAGVGAIALLMAWKFNKN